MYECNALWIGKYQQKLEKNMHQHQYFQFFAILNGNGSITVDGETYNIQKEQIYLVPPQSMHAVCGEEGGKETLKAMDIKFEVQDELLLKDLLSIGRSIQFDDFGYIIMLFDKMLRESTAQEKYYGNIVNLCLFELLIRIIRSTTTFSPIGRHDEPFELILPQNAVRGVDIKKLIQFINENYYRSITLDDLVAQAGVNKTTLINIFKEVYGVTPIRYINRLRLRKSEELLVKTDASISEIAEAVGFQSIHYFSRYFKQKMKCTPLEYRIWHNENWYYSF